MPDSKCVKCGAKIPKIAKFCPGCAAPKAVETPKPTQPQQPVQPQPVQPQPMQPQRSMQPQSMAGTIDTLFSKKLIILGTLLGILLAWIGAVIATFAGFNQNLLTAGNFINPLGFASLSLFLIGGGIVNKEIDKFVRLGMIVGGSITIGMGISVL